MAYSSIVKPSDYFNTKMYDGNGGTNALTGVGFQPDWTWIKNRDATDWHFLTDAVRGVTKTLHSNTTNAESTQATALTAFGSDGFTVGSDGSVNRNNQSFVAWNWKAGTTSGIATDGNTTITPSSYSFNQTNGFSVITYTGNGTSGAGVPHGLNAKPQMILVKRLNATDSWQVYTQPILNISNATKYLKLDANNAEATSNSRWNGYQPSTTNFYLGNDDSVNASGGTYIAYVFAAKTGFSKIGSYTGNGNANGPFIYTGFKPAFVLHKKSSAADDWNIFDNKRNPHNVVDKYLIPNSDGAEGTSTNRDFLSNGFKIRSSSNYVNQSGQTFFYMAFAENPLVANSGTDGVPATAR